MGLFVVDGHFSFELYEGPKHERFGNLRVLNDDTPSPGAVWPLHPHSQNEVVTTWRRASSDTRMNAARAEKRMAQTIDREGFSLPLDNRSRYSRSLWSKLSSFEHQNRRIETQ